MKVACGFVYLLSGTDWAIFFTMGSDRPEKNFMHELIF